MYVFACTNASVRTVSGTVTVRSGEVWHKDDPLVKAKPHLFSPVPPKVHATPGWTPEVVEQATRAPGERRMTRRGG